MPFKFTSLYSVWQLCDLICEFQLLNSLAHLWGGGGGGGEAKGAPTPALPQLLYVCVIQFLYLSLPTPVVIAPTRIIMWILLRIWAQILNFCSTTSILPSPYSLYFIAFITIINDNYHFHPHPTTLSLCLSFILYVYLCSPLSFEDAYRSRDSHH